MNVLRLDPEPKPPPPDPDPQLPPPPTREPEEPGPDVYDPGFDPEPLGADYFGRRPSPLAGEATAGGTVLPPFAASFGAG